MRLTNDILMRFVTLKTQMNHDKKEYEAIREIILATNGGQTKDFVAGIIERSRECLARVEEFENLLGRKWLLNNGLIYTTHYKEIEVVRRPDRTLEM